MSNKDSNDKEDNIDNINIDQSNQQTNIPKLRKKRKRPPLQIQRKNKYSLEKYILIDNIEEERDIELEDNIDDTLNPTGNIFKNFHIIYKYISIKLII